MLSSLLLQLSAVALSSAYLTPTWAPTYDMSLSTIIMPCNESGFTNVDSTEAKFGLVDFDWSNAKAVWAQQKPMDCEERLLTQAKMVKAANPNAKVWVYRNSIKALPWFSSVRNILQNPDYAPWFLKFSGENNYHVPDCDNNYSPPLCSKLYHDQVQTPGYPTGDGNCAAPACDVGGVPVGEYLFDFRANNVSIHGQTLLDWYVNSYAITNTSILSGFVNGLFLDDDWTVSDGPSEIDPHVLADCNLTKQDVVDITVGYNEALVTLQSALVAAQAFDWQSFVNPSTCAGPIVTNATCAKTLRSWCSASSPAQQGALLYGFTGQAGCSYNNALPDFDQDLANFLLIRGDYAWLGYAWIGCSRTYIRPPALDVDYGTPTGLCAETSSGSGVFVRDWTKATVQMDCNTWTATITMK
eukprot:TRINITY_DN1868_c0_g3_i1.p1 TRINITY_DN1868_c0_g3~~TRINITY_DN1868_c0_g3_i1.p1  ORF type:complete len:413 (+),score=136.21 TRINITY_DN1868_c0_g3_i1:257-1495(+)